MYDYLSLETQYIQTSLSTLSSLVSDILVNEKRKLQPTTVRGSCSVGNEWRKIFKKTTVTRHYSSLIYVAARSMA